METDSASFTRERSQAPSSPLATVGTVISRHGLEALTTTLAACDALSRADAPLDVAVLGQFKSGKSSLLNALLSSPAHGAGPDAPGSMGGRHDDLLPVGVLPVTAVVTRLRGPSRGAGEPTSLHATVTRLDGSAFDVPAASVGEFISEAENPGNVKGVAAVDIVTPALTDLPGLRLVDTPGLGSVHAHNTQATMDWLPGVALAIVAISVERPLSEEDRRLIRTLRPLAARVVIVLTKTDLVSAADLDEVREFIAHEVRETLELPEASGPVIVPFSVRTDRAAHVRNLRENILAPIAHDAESEKSAALKHKLTHLARTAREFLVVALKASEASEKGHDALLASILDESVKESVIDTELSLAARAVIGSARPAFEEALLPRQDEIVSRVVASLDEMRTWRGHLGKQSERYREFLRERIIAELTPLEAVAAPVAARLLGEAELRFRRTAEAFRDRLSRNLSASLGITLSPVRWEPPRVRVAAPPVAISQTFMTQWEILWWLLPMPLIGGLFRRHGRRKVPWEVWINLGRMAGGWSEATANAIESVRSMAYEWIRVELSTLMAMLATSDAGNQIAAIRASLDQLDACFPGIDRDAPWPSTVIAAQDSVPQASRNAHRDLRTSEQP